MFRGSVGSEGNAWRVPPVSIMLSFSAPLAGASRRLLLGQRGRHRRLEDAENHHQHALQEHFRDFLCARENRCFMFLFISHAKEWSVPCTQADEQKEEDEENQPRYNTEVYDFLLLSSPPFRVQVFTPGPKESTLAPEGGNAVRMPFDASVLHPHHHPSSRVHLSPARRRFLVCDVATVPVDAVVGQLLGTFGEVAVPRVRVRGVFWSNETEIWRDLIQHQTPRGQ